MAKHTRVRTPHHEEIEKLMEENGFHIACVDRHDIFWQKEGTVSAKKRELLLRAIMWRVTDIHEIEDEEEECESVAEDACPGCGCMPGDGATADCWHVEGCGYWKQLEG